jgi:polyferredoxin
MTWSLWRRVRQAVQALALALYVYLLFAALQRRAALPLADLFFRLDPLAGMAAMIASREWIPRLAPGLITLGVTLLLGRVWCGWLCPLGTLLEWVRLRPRRKLESPARPISPRWRRVKNVLLFLTLAAALFGSLSLLVFDPITLLTRSMTTAVLPAFNQAVTAAEMALYSIPAARPAVDWAETVLRGTVLPSIQPVFSMNVLLGLVLAGIFALNVFADRFWCRYLCPLGALLGLVSRVSLLRPFIGSACNRCAACDTVCRLDAIDDSKGYEIVPGECTVCLDCLAACPESRPAQRTLGGVGFRFQLKPAPSREYDPTRRQVLLSLAGAAAGVALLSSGIGSKERHPRLIRPPGADDEDTLLSRCIRCSQCMRVCPTSGLQPALFEAGLEGLWTPVLDSRLGYCDYGCNTCGQVCPSGAIPPLGLEEKRLAVLGRAVIDRNRCLPWADAAPCIVCEEMCPVPEKAIRLEVVTVSADDGSLVQMQRPHVIEDLCIGCGICEYRCPVPGEAAIWVERG